MIQLLFLAVWSGLYLASAYLSWTRIVGHWKIYLMMGYNWVYLSGVFVLFPKLGHMVAYLHAHLA